MRATLTHPWRWASNRTAAALLAWGAVLPITLAAQATEPGALTAATESVAAVIPPIGALSVAPRFLERLLLVDLNRQQLDQAALVLESATGELYLWVQDLQRWRLKIPAAALGIVHQNEPYFPLSAISHVSHHYDSKALTLAVELRADAFLSSRLTTRYDTLPPPVKPGPGGFFNYDVVMLRSPESSQSSGLFELGLFNGLGVGIGTWLVDSHDPHAPVTRLATTWVVDTPEKMRSLRFGDAINAPGSWGRSVQFGGVQYGTNFGTQPGFVTLPLQSAVGQAVLPSTVDVFINRALVSHQSVPPGPFSISNLPVVSGAGEVQLIVRDLLGREQVISRPFYASQSLLRTGLKSFSMEFGFVRENFGLRSNDYGDWLASGTYRQGVSDSLTGELHGEAMPGQATVGAGADFLVPRMGLLSGYLVASHGPTGLGGLLMVGVERQAQPWSLGLRMQWASLGFSQVGAAPLPFQPAPAMSSSASLSYAAGPLGSLGFAYVQQRNRGADDTRIATLSYSVSIGKWGSLTVAALRDLQGKAGTSVLAMWSVPLGMGSSFSVSSQQVRGSSAGNSDAFNAALQKNLPLGQGYGYRLDAGQGGAGDAAIYWQNDVGSYTLEASRFQGATATRWGASGGVAFLGGDMFPSRRIEQSFAIARIADYPNVRVLADNQPAGRTDYRGNAILPRLRAYDVNVIALDQRDLPMDAKIGAVKVEVVPYFRSGLDVHFPVTHARGATLTLRLEDGNAVPAGTTATLDGSNEVFTVGTDGEVYVVGLGPKNTLRVTWPESHCRVDFPYTPKADPLPDLGIYRCKLEQP